METLDTRSFKEKVRDAKNKVKWKAEDTIKWVKEHPTAAATIVSGVAVTAKTTLKIVKTVVNACEAKERKKEVYCNDIQSTIRLKHELSYQEARELRDRMDAGQTKFEALDYMNLIKR